MSESRPSWRGGETWSTLMEATAGPASEAADSQLRLKRLLCCSGPVLHDNTHCVNQWVCSTQKTPLYFLPWYKNEAKLSCLLELPRCLRSRDLRCSRCAAAGYIYVAVFKRLADGLTVTHEGKSNHITLMTKTHVWTRYSSIQHVTSLCGSCS